MDHFLRPKAERHAQGWDSPTGCYEDSYDYSTFRRVLVEPFRMALGASFVTSAFDPARDVPAQTKWITAPANTVLIVDGVFLHRPELAGLWNYSIWLDVPTDVALARFTAPDGTDSSPAAIARSIGAERLYRAEASPRTGATAIIDNADFEHPRRVFADSC